MNTILWAFLWSILGWLVGILAFFGTGLIAISLDPERRNKAANYYSELAMKLLNRAALVEKGTGYDIYQTNHDPDKNADKINIDGQTAHVSNETGLLSTLHKRDLGLVPPPEEDVGVYVSPEIGELGEVETERHEKNTLRDQAGHYQPNVTLTPTRPLVRLREYARRMVPESRSLWDLDETVELYKQSQHGFMSSRTTQFMILIIAYGASSLLAWLIMTNAGGTVPSGVNVPGLGGMLLPPVGWP